MLKEGVMAPDFVLPDQNGVLHTLQEYRGKRVVLYFYPKDMTSGCTKQACGFAERYPLFREKGAVILGVSRDTVVSHKKFEEKYGLPFTLLADPDRKVHEAYGVLYTKKTDKGEKPAALRATYLIDEEGRIVRAMEKVKAADNPEDMLQLL